MKKEPRKKYNTIQYGTLAGLVVPVFVFIIFYFAKSEHFSQFSDYIDFLTTRGIYTKMASLSLIPNLLLFYFFMNRNALLAARGVILATFLFGGGALLVYHLF